MSSVRLILLHGLASTPKEFSLLTHPLRRLGVSLTTPEIPGYSHASMPGPQGARQPVSWERWVASAAAKVEAIAAESSEPFVLGGLCTGAMLATAVAARQQHPNMRGLALLSPLFAYDGWGLPWWYRLRHVAYALKLDRHFAMGERAPYGLKNERVRSMVRQQMESAEPSMVGPSKVPLPVVRESERLSRHVRRLLASMTQPMVVLHARDDEICRLRSVNAAMATATSAAELRTHVLENSFHMIPADNDRQEVARHLASFVSSQVAGAGSAGPLAAAI